MDLHSKVPAILVFALLALAALPLYASAASSGSSGGGVSVAKSMIAPEIMPENPTKYFTLRFNTGWNLFSVPIHTPYKGSAAFAAVVKTDCAPGTLYYYDAVSKAYAKEGTMSTGAQIGATKGYWFKSARECSATVSGSEYLSSFDRLLSPGWNQIGALYRPVSFDEIKGTCIATSGPYKFNTAAYNWEKTQKLMGGEGYFVKVAADCKLSGQEPPYPPEVTPTATTKPTTTIVIEEFSDFQCPFCKRVQPTLEQLEGEYAGKATIRRVFKHFPLAFHPDAQNAAEASECARNEGKFDVYRDLLFESDDLSVSALKRYAIRLGISAESFNYCLDNHKTSSIVKRDIEEGTSRGVTGTPTFFINGQKLVGAQPIESFEKIIDSILNEVTPTPTITPDCAYSGDGTYTLSKGCSIKASDGSKVTLKEVVESKPLQANFELRYSDGQIANYNYYLSEGDSAYPFGEGQLYIKVEGISALKSYPVQYLAKVTVKSGGTPTSTPGFDVAVTDLEIYPETPKVGESFAVIAKLHNYGDAGGYLNAYSISFSGSNVAAGIAQATTQEKIYLAPGADYSVKSYHTLYDSGYWKVTFIASPSTSDMNYLNNQKSESFYMSGTPSPTATTQPTCMRYGDGTYTGIPIGCYILSNSGYFVRLVDISSSAPAQAQFEITDKYQKLIKKVYLGQYESATISEAGNLYLYVGNMYPASYHVKTTLDITVNSGSAPTVTTFPSCIYYSDGRYESLNIGCIVFTTGGYKVELKDISAFSPQQAQIDVSDKSGNLLKKLYLEAGGSAVVSEANNLLIEVNKLFPGAFAKQGVADITIKSGPYNTPTPTPSDLPDLYISTSGTTQSTVGKEAVLNVIVSNLGKATAPATTIKWGGYMSGFWSVPQLAPGGIYSNSLSVIIVNQPYMEIIASVDPSNTIKETDEGNNQFNYMIYPTMIANASTTPTPTPNIILHRTVRDCGTDLAIGGEQVFPVGGSTGYTNFKCYNRKNELCSDVDPYDMYYDEWCEYPSSSGGGGG